jgi:ribosomal protein S18 acetylase RimI-like enzyme
MRSRPEIRIATNADEATMGQTLSAAFQADPVFRWLYPDHDRRVAAIPDAFALFVQAIGPRGASHVTADGAGVALWVPPGEGVVDEAQAEVFGEKLLSISPADADRMETLTGMLEAAHPHEEAWYLNFLGVSPVRQGHGVGSALLRAALHRADAEYMPAFLVATSNDNRRLYARHGFDVLEELQLPDGPIAYAMWRTPE